MLATLTKAHVHPLIDLNDQVNQLTSRESEINSTRIVVQGDQSHGKSSLLEALSGVDLPRGDDIKTRVPLIMQLRSCEDADQEHAFISRKGAEPERIALSEVAAKVDEFTEAIAGGSKGVKDEPIELKVFRRDQDDLTLIDLPGITRVGREGQGDGKQLEALILGMCKRYSAPPESVILNVVSAMVDFSTSASLQLSQELDPEGRRTLLCVTKIDQHKEPGLAKKIDVSIESMCIRPEHVFVVRNRKQEENDAHLPLSRARELETECIRSNLELERGAEATGYGLGVSALSEQLVRIQLERIIETLPATAKAIRARLSQLEQRVAQIGPPLEGELACRLLAAKLVDKTREQLEKEREGRVSRAAGLQTAEGEVFDIKLEVDDWVACCSKKAKILRRKRAD